ncbi:MAG: hypothetical protein JSR80_06470 [Verrucomicrobia bacterium]|nr:hypothetical protein [Verrucomicrobiota bacterium]
MFIVSEIIDLQEMTQRLTNRSAEAFRLSSSAVEPTPAIVLQQAVLSLGRQLAMDAFFPEQKNSPYVQTLQSLSKAGQVLPSDDEWMQKKVTQILLTLCSKAGKIATLPNASTLIFFVETGEPIAELVKKEGNYFVKGIEHIPIEPADTLFLPEVTQEEINKIKNYLNCEREAQADTPSELGRIRSILGQQPLHSNDSPASCGLTITIGLIICCRILHLYRTGRLTSSDYPPA